MRTVAVEGNNGKTKAFNGFYDDLLSDGADIFSFNLIFQKQATSKWKQQFIYLFSKLQDPSTQKLYFSFRVLINYQQAFVARSFHLNCQFPFSAVTIIMDFQFPCHIFLIL